MAVNFIELRENFSNRPYALRDDTKIMTHTLQWIISLPPPFSNLLRYLKITVPPTYRLNIEIDLQSLHGLLCTALLIGWDPATPPFPPPQLGSYTRALLVSQDRRHLFFNPCSNVFAVLLLNSFQLQPPLNRERFHQTLSNSVRSTRTERNPANPCRKPEEESCGYVVFKWNINGNM